MKAKHIKGKAKMKAKVKHTADGMQGKMHDHLGKHKDGLKDGHTKLETVPAGNLGGEKYGKTDSDGDYDND